MKFYNILGVEKGAGKDEIKKAYKKMAIKYHPDKEGGDEEKFKEISEAYEILSDDDKRRKYDMLGDEGWRNNGDGGGMRGGMNPQDLFAQFFSGEMGGGGGPFGGMGGFGGMFGMHGGQGGPGGQGVPRQRNHHVHQMTVSLKEAFSGFKRHIRCNVEKPCLDCREQCYTCQGKGSITQMNRIGIFTQIVNGICNECKGTGSKVNGKPSCNNCHGQGHTKGEHTLTVDVPPGVSTGFHQRFDGFGEQKMTPDDIAGDLIVEIHVKEDDAFMRSGNDLHLETNITLWESIIGKELSITLFDEVLKIDTRAFGNGIIQPHKKYVVTGKGMPDTKNTNGARGNLVIGFKVEYPSKKLTNDERNAIGKTLESLSLH
jgi:DnaJ-class molecular chaperone